MEDIQPEEELHLDEDYSIDQQEDNKENVGTGIAAADFDPERTLYDIKKSINGFDKRDGKYVRVSYPMARTEFINLYINSLRSLLNFPNLFSQKTGKEAAFDMMEGLKEITYAAVDYGVKEEHIETFINMYDTLKSTFYGIIIDGRGTENVKQTLIGIYEKISKDGDKNSTTDGFINWGKVQEDIRGRA